MGRRVDQARQILRHLLVGRIRFTPQADGVVEFVGHASLRPLVAGTVLADVSKAVVSPPILHEAGRLWGSPCSSWGASPAPDATFAHLTWGSIDHQDRVNDQQPPPDPRAIAPTTGAAVPV